MENELTTKEKGEATNTLVRDRMRLFRQQRGLSLEDVAEYLGITYQQVQKYENGSRKTHSGLLQNLADLYKIKVADFFAESDSNDWELLDKTQLQVMQALTEIKNEHSQKHLRDTIKFLVKLEGK